MDNTHNFRQLGGGGKISRTLIKARLEHYATRKLHTTLTELRPEHRQDIIAVLYGRFAYTIAEIQEILGISRSLVYRDLQAASFFQKRFPKRKEHADTIYDYILYNAKYIN